MKHLSPIYFFVAFFIICLALAGCGIFDVVIITENQEVLEDGASAQSPVQTTPTSERTTPVSMATETPPPTATSTSVPVPSPIASGLVVYETSFDSLPLGRTQPHPGAPGQDGWFEDFSATDAYGEIQNAVAVSGQALHEYKDSSARKFLKSIDFSRYPIITLQVDFYAQVSDLDAVNEYDAFIGFYDNSHPGFEMLGFQLRSGPGPVAKSAGGANIDINVFNGVNGYDLMRFDVGQDLDWNTWHTVTLIADQAADRYVSLTVDGQTQDLSAYQLPRSYTGHGGWVRGKLIQQLLTHIIQPDGGGSDFGIYWDNLSITVRPALDETAPVTPIPDNPTATPGAAWLPNPTPGMISWKETTSLPIASSVPFNDARGQQLIFHNGYVYVFGGSSASNNQLTNVYFSAIEEDGTLAGWVETTSLPGRYYDHVVVKVGNYVYLLTGAASSTYVAYAPLNADGSVGNWIGTTPLAPGRQQFAAASHGNFIYVTGGNSGGNQAWVQYASTKPNGSLGNWSFTIPMPDKLQAHTMLAYNGYLYVFGGINANNEWVATVYYSAIEPDGTLAGWETASSLPIKMSGYSTFESNGFVYLIGGSSSTSYYTRILENHALDKWEKITPLPNTRIHGLRTGAYNGFAYAVGGYKNGYQSGVYYGFIGVQQPPESPTPVPEAQTPSPPSAPIAGTLTPGPLTCQLNIHQNIHVLDGTNLWSQPDVVNGSLIGTLPAGGFVYVINGPAWGLIVETGVSGWWWEISNAPNGTSLGWIWEGRIEDCSTLNSTFTPTPAETPGDENPDKFAFTACVGNINSCEIYVMNADGSNLVQLTDNNDHDRSPAWSPDGTKIAFASNRDGDYEIYVMNPDGSEQMRLTASLHSTSSPNWSPDGTKITFISIYEGIYTMNADGSDVTKILSDNRVMFDLAWSPDGSKMAFIISTSPSLDEIFILDADGTNLTRLLSAPIGVQNFDPAWSPDGTRIAFVLHDGDLNMKIYTVNADGSNPVFLTNGWSPAWSSDSSKIAYVSCIEDSYGAETCGIYQMDANGNNPVQLTSSIFLDFDGLAWFEKPKIQIIQHPDCTSGWTQLEAGSQAEVSAESDTPNRVRSDPGTDGEIIALLYPGHEVFVIEGPICVDGLVFWRVESDAIPGGEGWMAEGDGAVYWLAPKDN